MLSSQNKEDVSKQLKKLKSVIDNYQDRLSVVEFRCLTDSTKFKIDYDSRFKRIKQEEVVV